MSKLLLTTLISGAGGALLLIAGFAAGQHFANAQQASRVFELRTYYCEPGKLPNLLARFREHTTKIFEKHNMSNVIYMVPQDAPASENTLYYIISHPSREQAKKSWDEFRNDPEWKTVQAESEKGGKIVSKVDSVFLNPTDFSPIK